MAEELGPQRMIGQDAGVQHVRVGQQHAGRLADAAAGALRRIAVVGGRQRVDDAVAGPFDERLPLAELILRQRLGRVEIERPGQRIARQRFEHRRVEAQRLAAGRGGGDHHVLPRERRVDRLRLMRVEPLGPGRGQRPAHGRAELDLQLAVARRPDGDGLRMDQLPRVVAPAAQLVQEGVRIEGHALFYHQARALPTVDRFIRSIAPPCYNERAVCAEPRSAANQKDS